MSSGTQQLESNASVVPLTCSVFLPISDSERLTDPYLFICSSEGPAYSVSAISSLANDIYHRTERFGHLSLLSNGFCDNSSAFYFLFVTIQLVCILIEWGKRS
jgi:hypothetical protein